MKPSETHNCNWNLEQLSLIGGLVLVRSLNCLPGLEPSQNIVWIYWHTSMSGLGPPSGGARVCNLQAAPLHQVHTIKATRKYSADVHCCRGPQKFWIVHALDMYIGVRSLYKYFTFPGNHGCYIDSARWCWWWHTGNQRYSGKCRCSWVHLDGAVVALLFS